MDENTSAAFIGDKVAPGLDLQDTQTMKLLPVRQTKPWTAGFSLVALCYLIWAMLPTSGWLEQGRPVTIDAENVSKCETSAKTLVPFEAHIMSKCPDARDCLRELVRIPQHFGVGYLI